MNEYNNVNSGNRSYSCGECSASNDSYRLGMNYEGVQDYPKSGGEYTLQQ